MRALRRTFVLVIAMLLLAGCAGLPRSSTVNARQAISNSPPPHAPNVYPNPPQPGESPREIVEDFLRANSSPDEDFQVARMFLTSSASNAWDPTGHPIVVTTTEQQYSVTEQYGAPVSARAKGLATLDGTGKLTQLPTHEDVSGSFHLKKVGGEWRISELPSKFGAWISLADFNRLYTSYEVYFADTATRTLVPDTRWYLSSGGQATALARAVLGAAPSWMKGMSHKAMPTGTRLEVDAVPINNDGLATVDLSDQALQADSATRRATWAAMMATLDELPSVHTVRLTVGGSPLAVGRDTSAVATPEDLGYAQGERSGSALIMRNGSQLGWVDPMRRAARPNLVKPQGDRPGLPTLNTNWTFVSASGDGRTIAAISGDHRTLGLWVHRHLTAQNFGRDLIQPTFTRFDELWVAGKSLSAAGQRPSGKSGGSVVWVVDTGAPAARAKPQVVSVPWLGDREVLAMKASPEGERMAMVVRTRSGKTQLLLAGIVRDHRRMPISLSTPTQVARPVSNLKDVTWVDESTVAVLGQDPVGSVTQPIMVPLGGLVTVMGAAPGAIAVVGTGTGPAQIYAITDRGTVLERSGRRWQEFGSGSAVIVPGA